jgi:hypothetical protein
MGEDLDEEDIVADGQRLLRRMWLNLGCMLEDFG